MKIKHDALPEVSTNNNLSDISERERIINDFFDSMHNFTTYEGEDTKIEGTEIESARGRVLAGDDVNEIKIYGYDPAADEYKDLSIIEHAVIMEDLEMIEVLIERKASIEGALSKIIYFGYTGMIELLVDLKVDLKIASSKIDHTPLELAFEWDDLELAKLLIENGAILNNDSNTALHACARIQGFDGQMVEDSDAQINEIVKALIKYGVDLEGKQKRYPDEPYKNPLFVAIEYNQLNIAKIFLEHGANPDEIDIDEVVAEVTRTSERMGINIKTNTEKIINSEINHWLSVAKAIKKLSLGDIEDIFALEELRDVSPTGRELAEKYIKNKVEGLYDGIYKHKFKQTLLELSNLNKAITEGDIKNLDISPLDEALKDWNVAEGGAILKLEHQAMIFLLENVELTDEIKDFITNTSGINAIYKKVAKVLGFPELESNSEPQNEVTDAKVANQSITEEFEPSIIGEASDLS